MKSAEGFHKLKDDQFFHIYMITIVAFLLISASFLLGYVVAIVPANNTTKEMTSVTFEADQIYVNGVQYNFSKDKIKTISGEGEENEKDRSSGHE